MKLFLFGGAEAHDGHSNVEPLFKLIEQVINDLKPKQILHIPFARIIALEPEWEGDWFNRYFHFEGIEYLNASNEADVEKADSPLILITGGREHANLLGKIHGNPRLEQLIRNAKYIIGESAGSMVLGMYLRGTNKNGESELVPGIGIIKDTIIEPHYIERNRQALLEQEVKEKNLKYGIGVDVATAIVFDVADFPEKYDVIGDGIVEVKRNK